MLSHRALQGEFLAVTVYVFELDIPCLFFPFEARAKIPLLSVVWTNSIFIQRLWRNERPPSRPGISRIFKRLCSNFLFFSAAKDSLPFRMTCDHIGSRCSENSLTRLMVTRFDFGLARFKGVGERINLIPIRNEKLIWFTDYLTVLVDETGRLSLYS